MAVVEEHVVMGRYLAPKTSITTWAELTPLSERHIRRMCEEGKVKAKQVGRRWLVDTADALRVFGFSDGD